MRLDELRGRLGQVVDLLEPLGHALADVADALVERRSLDSRFCSSTRCTWARW